MYILHASLQLLMQIVLQVTNEWMSASSQLANDESSLTQCIGLLQWPQNILTVTVVTVLKCNTCSISLWQSLYMNICSTWQVVAVYDDDIHFMWLSVSLIMANCHPECKSLYIYMHGCMWGCICICMTVYSSSIIVSSWSHVHGFITSH